MISGRQRLGEDWDVIESGRPRVYEPLDREPPVSVVALPGVKEPNCRRGEILVLDDEVALAEMLAEFLSILGYHAEICSSAPLALSLIQEKDFDLIISDFRMPCMNGEQFFQQLTAQSPGMAGRVIFVTGDVGGTEADLFFKCNSVRRLNKPYTLPGIQKVVEDCLESLLPPADFSVVEDSEINPT